ncbi:MAG: hypothetical protein ACR2PQ_10255 [Myxococcota bacterium]
MSALKTGTLVLWLLCAAAFFVDTSLSGTGQALFWVLLIAHACESLFFLGKLREAPGGFGPNLLQTLLFGMFHLREIGAVGGGGDSPA